MHVHGSYLAARREVESKQKLRRPGLQREHHTGTQYSCFTRSQSFEHLSYKNVKLLKEMTTKSVIQCTERTRKFKIMATKAGRLKMPSLLEFSCPFLIPHHAKIPHHAFRRKLTAELKYLDFILSRKLGGKRR